MPISECTQSNGVHIHRSTDQKCAYLPPLYQSNTLSLSSAVISLVNFLSARKIMRHPSVLANCSDQKNPDIYYLSLSHSSFFLIIFFFFFLLLTFFLKLSFSLFLISFFLSFFISLFIFSLFLSMYFSFFLFFLPSFLFSFFLFFYLFLPRKELGEACMVDYSILFSPVLTLQYLIKHFFITPNPSITYRFKC